MLDVNALKFGEDGLLPGVVQAPWGEVRMVGYLNREALERTLATGFVTFWSRSRQELWTKGERSGNWLRLLGARADCDGDCLLLVAEPSGPTCHRGTESCFDGSGEDAATLPWMHRLEELLRSRRTTASLEGSYTQRLFAGGVDRIAKKVVEEAGEVVLAAKNLQAESPDLARQEFLGEAADLLFHLELLLVDRGASLEEVVRVLRSRHSARSGEARS